MATGEASDPLVKLLTPAVLLLVSGTASAGHGGGHGEHGGLHSSGHHSGFHTIRHGGYRTYNSYGYGLGYGYGGYSYPSYGYSYSANGINYPNCYSALPTVIGGGIVPASGGYPVEPTAAPSAVTAAAAVTVVVQEGAQVWFDGKDVTGPGPDRVFTSPILQTNQTSVLSVKVSWNGSTSSMQLAIRAGDKIRVDPR